MKRPECAIKGCTNEGFIGYAGTWICGSCLAKIEKKKMESEMALMEEIGND